MKWMGLALLLLLLAVASTAHARGISDGASLSLDLPPLTAEFALSNPSEAFELWLQTYQKDYRDNEAEKTSRRAVFEANAAVVAEHNARNDATYTLALNEFADLTFEEFARTKLGYDASLRAGRANRAPAQDDVVDIPGSIDWREKGVVTDVKNQGQCGSCWAFSATGAIEGINAIRTGELVSLSEQQLVSCDRKQDMGCSGGLMDNAFDYVVANGGLDTEDDWGYWAFDMPCQRVFEKDRKFVSIDGHEDVPINDGGALKKAIAKQPVSVAICASISLQLYSSGVVTDKACCQDLNHGVLAVGYVDEQAADGEDPHWIIKNSWGAGWGEEGFFRLSIASSHPDGACGVYQAASYPIKKDDSNPEPLEVCGFLGWKDCPAHNSCACETSFFGLFCLPWAWGCQADAVAAA